MISVIMPVYNDSQNIGSSIEETHMFLEGYGLEYELIIVNDGSIDDTYINALSIATKHNIKLN